uniref:type I protein arginine methyltransferase n=1 Tax=Meloidogyne javanica TaxID=6303 RepID=A0A915LHM5_MELJA
MNPLDLDVNFSQSFSVKFCNIDENIGEICDSKLCSATFIEQGKILVLKGGVNLQKHLHFYQWLHLAEQFLSFRPISKQVPVCELMVSEPFLLRFESNKDLQNFCSLLPQSELIDNEELSHSAQNSSRKRKCLLNNEMNSEFNSRTEEGSAKQYFQFYGSLFQQQNMMQDYTRTATYQRAIHENYLDFRDKVILDVGAGSGILSFFAAQVGAKRVYAVEASSMADSCKSLVSANALNEVIKVITGKIEEIELPESVDVIISEPMGYIDEQVYLEQTARSSFWTQESFHGINLSSLKSAALEEVFRQPIVDTWHIGILMSTCISWNFNFENDEAKRLQRIEIPFEFNALRTGYIHGLATWFDVGFMGQTKTVYLSTAPTEPLTHWYQVRLLIKNPLFVTIGQLVIGKLLIQSYDLDLEIEVGDKRQQNKLDLKMPHFRYNGQPVSQPPPGNSTENPLEQLNQHLAIAVATAQQQQLNNGNNNLNFSPAYSTCLYTNSLTNSGGKDYSATTTSADILVQNGTLNG